MGDSETKRALLLVKLRELSEQDGFMGSISVPGEELHQAMDGLLLRGDCGLVDQAVLLFGDIASHDSDRNFGRRSTLKQLSQIIPWAKALAK